MDSFVIKCSILINTVDHIRETIANISDLVVTLVDTNFAEKIEFGQEEDQILVLINSVVEGLKKLVDQPIEQSISSFISKTNWDTQTSSVQTQSAYISEVKERVTVVVDLMRGNVASIYFAKVLNSFCKIINDHFVNSIFKIKRLSDSGNQQLILGKSPLRGT